jgi:hypothetical protein
MRPAPQPASDCPLELTAPRRGRPLEPGDRAPCVDPECSRPKCAKTVSGRRFGFAGRMHVVCYSRRATAARKRGAETLRPATPTRQFPTPPKRFALDHRSRRDVPGWCPGPDHLDRMSPAACADLIREAWGSAWAALLFTAEHRPGDDSAREIEVTS